MKLAKTFYTDVSYRAATIAERMAFVIRANGLTRSAAARKLGVSPQTLHWWLDKSRKPTVNSLILFAKTFDVTMDWLAGMEDDES